MNKIVKISMALLATFLLSSCGGQKPVALEGSQVLTETTQLQGVEMVETLSDDGSRMVQVPYKWYAGIGKADDKQIAIELAQNEARATISRVIETMVTAQAERGAIANNGVVQQALRSYWKQVSQSVQNACEPIGETKVEFNPADRMYTVTAKVGIRGDRYQQLINSAGNYRPANLSPEDLQIFLETNEAIMNAAKAN